MNKNNLTFPDPHTADHEGLLAIGGDLSPQRLLQAYSQGIFPWYDSKSPILWWSPDPRLILIPKDFKLSQSLKKTLKKPFTFSIDKAFSEVITACASNAERKDNTWITAEMIHAYNTLHQLGYAHSFEVWLEDKLVGGLYGVSLGKAFFGESMFHKTTDASKLALYYLSLVMQAWNFDFIDCQLPTNHLQRLGAQIISREKFLHILGCALQSPTKQGPWLSLA